MEGALGHRPSKYDALLFDCFFGRGMFRPEAVFLL